MPLTGRCWEPRIPLSGSIRNLSVVPGRWKSREGRSQRTDALSTFPKPWSMVGDFTPSLYGQPFTPKNLLDPYFLALDVGDLLIAQHPAIHDACGFHSISSTGRKTQNRKPNGARSPPAGPHILPQGVSRSTPRPWRCLAIPPSVRPAWLRCASPEGGPRYRLYSIVPNQVPIEHWHIGRTHGGHDTGPHLPSTSAD